MTPPNPPSPQREPEATSEDRWFYQLRSDSPSTDAAPPCLLELGPVSSLELLRMSQAGVIDGETPVRREAESTLLAARQVLDELEQRPEWQAELKRQRILRAKGIVRRWREAMAKARANRPARANALFRRWLAILGVLWALCLLPFADHNHWILAPKAPRADSGADLEMALAEADRLDPGWRLDQQEARRPVLPEAENAARTILAVKERLPRGWPTWRSLNRLTNRELSADTRLAWGRDLHDLPPPVQLNAQQTAVLKGELQHAEDALAEACRLTDQPHGHPPTVPPTFSVVFLLLNPQITPVRPVATLLALDVLLQSQEGRLRQALASWHAMLNAARAVGDRPNDLTVQVRVAYLAGALQLLERVLAQGVPPAAALQTIQQLLEDEANQPLHLMAARGERAIVNHLLRSIQDRSFSRANLEMLLSGPLTPSAVREANEDEPPGEARKWYSPEQIKMHRARFLRYMTAFVEICKRPDPERSQRLEQLRATLAGHPAFLRLVCETNHQTAASCRSVQAELRCAIAALAVERFRQAHGGWPASLDALVPDLLAEVPADPFDGHPLRLRKDGEGVVIYSVGPDGQDNGGKSEDLNIHRPGTDLGFRLWGPRQRRQPPMAPWSVSELAGAKRAGQE